MGQEGGGKKLFGGVLRVQGSHMLARLPLGLEHEGRSQVHSNAISARRSTAQSATAGASHLKTSWHRVHGMGG